MEQNRQKVREMKPDAVPPERLKDFVKEYYSIIHSN